jgi:hypothetical protein
MATIGSLTADLSLKAATFIRDLDRATDSVRRSSRDMERHASQIQRGFDRAGAAVKSFGVGLASAIGVGSVAGVARLSKDTLDAAGNLGEMATAAGLARESCKRSSSPASRSACRRKSWSGRWASLRIASVRRCAA